MNETKLKQVVHQAFKKFPPNITGGCFLATRWIKEKLPEVTEKVITIRYKTGTLEHCIGILPDERIIDTQIFQIAILLPIPKKFVHQGIFTKKEYEKLIPEWNKLPEC